MNRADLDLAQKDFESALDAAATDFCESWLGNSKAGCRLAFKGGARWVLQSDTVQALVDKLAELRGHAIDQGFPDDSDGMIGVDEALFNYKAAKGGS